MIGYWITDVTLCNEPLTTQYSRASGICQRHKFENLKIKVKCAIVFLTPFYIITYSTFNCWQQNLPNPCDKLACKISETVGWIGIKFHSYDSYPTITVPVVMERETSYELYHRSVLGLWCTDPLKLRLLFYCYHQAFQ